jgi:hypothetical protein
MDRERARAKEMLPIIQAFADGRAIQWRASLYDPWITIDCLSDISLTNVSEYRIKPEPSKPREWWINEYASRMEAYDSRGWADIYAGPDRIRCIHVREVLDDEEGGLNDQQ